MTYARRTSGSGGGAVASGARVTISAAQSLASTATDQVINWDAEEFDTDSYHDNATNNSRLTVPSGMAGKVIVGGGILTSDTFNSSRTIQCVIRKNGTTKLKGSFRKEFIGAIMTHGVGTVIEDNAAAGDYYEFLVTHSDGGARALDAANCGFWISRVGS